MTDQHSIDHDSVIGHEGPGLLVWADQDEQDVRPYLVTGGRTEARYVLRLESLLAAAPPPSAPGNGASAPRRPADGSVDGSEGGAVLPPEADQVLELCRARRHTSVAEIAAWIGQPVQVAKILIGDLLDRCALVRAASGDLPGGASAQEVLEAAVAGLEARFSGAA